MACRNCTQVSSMRGGSCELRNHFLVTVHFVIAEFSHDLVLSTSATMLMLKGCQSDVYCYWFIGTALQRDASPGFQQGYHGAIRRFLGPRAKDHRSKCHCRGSATESLSGRS